MQSRPTLRGKFTLFPSSDYLNTRVSLTSFHISLLYPAIAIIFFVYLVVFQFYGLRNTTLWQNISVK